MGFAIGFDFELGVVDERVDAGLEVIGYRGDGSGEFKLARSVLFGISHTETEVQIARGKERGCSGVAVGWIVLEELGFELRGERIKPIMESLETGLEVILENIVGNQQFMQRSPGSRGYAQFIGDGALKKEIGMIDSVEADIPQEIHEQGE